MVTANPFVKAGNGLRYLWFSTGPVDYFPLTYTSLWLEWQMWGANPMGYHIVNVLLHALSSILLWRIFLRLKIPGAWLAAALFAVHPVNVESVAWIAERKNTLSFLFFALTLLLFLRFEEAGKKRTYILSLLAFIAALLSKTAVAPLPFVLLLLMMWQRGKIEKRDIQRTIPFFLFALILGLVTIWFQYHRAIAEDVIHGRNFIERVLGAGWALWFYFLKALCPLHLCFVYPEPDYRSHSLLAWLPLISGIGLLIFLWRRRSPRKKALLISLAYFGLMLLPVLGFLKIYFHRYSLVADHWQYFSLPAITAMVAGTFFFAGRGFSQAVTSKNRNGLSRSLALPWLFGGALLVIFSILSWKHTFIFRDSEMLWRDTLEKNPGAWVAHNNLGLLCEQQGKIDDSVLHYQQSLSIKPAQVEGHNNLGTALLNRGQLDEAMAEFQAALKLNPNIAMSHYNIGNVLDQRGERDEALGEYREALRLNPDFADAHNNYGCLLAAGGELDKAVSHFRQGLETEPDHLSLLNNLGSLLVEQQKATEAIPYLNRAVALNPNYADAHLNLGNALLAAGQAEAAAPHYLSALQINPRMKLVHYKLGIALQQLGKSEEALAQYTVALEVEPTLAEAHYRIAVLLASDKKIEGAISHLKEAARLAGAGNQKQLADDIQKRLQLYQASQPFPE